MIGEQNNDDDDDDSNSSNIWRMVFQGCPSVSRLGSKENDNISD